MADMCTDGRFEIIAKAKKLLIDTTNITEEELKVADNFLFRCWQMGWLDSVTEYESKEYDFGNERKLLVNYSDRGTAIITKQFIEQVMIPKFEKDEINRWHDLKKNPEDLPEYSNYYVLIFYRRWSHVVDDYVLDYDRRLYLENGKFDINYGYEHPSRMIAWKYIEPFEVEE